MWHSRNTVPENLLNLMEFDGLENMFTSTIIYLFKRWKTWPFDTIWIPHLPPHPCLEQ